MHNTWLVGSWASFLRTRLVRISSVPVPFGQAFLHHCAKNINSSWFSLVGSTVDSWDWDFVVGLWDLLHNTWWVSFLWTRLVRIFSVPFGQAFLHRCTQNINSSWFSLVGSTVGSWDFVVGLWDLLSTVRTQYPRCLWTNFLRIRLGRNFSVVFGQTSLHCGAQNTDFGWFFLYSNHHRQWARGTLSWACGTLPGVLVD